MENDMEQAEEYFNQYDYKGRRVIEILIEKLNLFDTPKILSQFESTLDNLDYPDVMVDLKNVTHIDSVGIGFLIASKNICTKHDRDMLVISNNETILKIFNITKIESYFKIFNTLDEAVMWIENKEKDTV